MVVECQFLFVKTDPAVKGPVTRLLPNGGLVDENGMLVPTEAAETNRAMEKMLEDTMQSIAALFSIGKPKSPAAAPSPRNVVGDCSPASSAGARGSPSKNVAARGDPGNESAGRSGALMLDDLAPEIDDLLDTPADVPAHSSLSLLDGGGGRGGSLLARTTNIALAAHNNNHFGTNPHVHEATVAQGGAEPGQPPNHIDHCLNGRAWHFLFGRGRQVGW